MSFFSFQLALDDMIIELESNEKAVYICGLCRQSDEIRSLVENTKVMLR